jgi:hypothetical protein
MMVILSRGETIELFKQRPKEYTGGFIHIPIAGKRRRQPLGKAGAESPPARSPKGGR